MTMKRVNSPLAANPARAQCQRMEEMDIRLISVVEEDRRIHARLQAQAPSIGVCMWLEVRFNASDGTTRRQWAAEAYDRALAVLDPA